MADVALALVWTEPVSAVYSSIRQSQAEADLDDLREEFGSGEGELSRAEARALARRFTGRLEPGGAIGRIKIDRTGTNTVLVEGTESGDLQIGPGRYPGSALPGQGRTVAIAGHRTTYGAPFREIDRLDRGDEIVIEMPYGTFVYAVTGRQIVPPEQSEVVGDTGVERVVLTACHPLFSAAERYVVSARLESSRR
jgi:sortase A